MSELSASGFLKIVQLPKLFHVCALHRCFQLLFVYFLLDNVSLLSVFTPFCLAMWVFCPCLPLLEVSCQCYVISPLSIPAETLCFFSLEVLLFPRLFLGFLVFLSMDSCSLILMPVHFSVI